MVITKRSAAGAASGPFAAIWRSSRALSMRCRGEALSSCRISPRTLGAVANNCCARSRASVAITYPPYFDERLVVAQASPSGVVRMVLFLDALLGKQALGVTRAIGDEIVVFKE